MQKTHDFYFWSKPEKKLRQLRRLEPFSLSTSSTVSALIQAVHAGTTFTCSRRLASK